MDENKGTGVVEDSPISIMFKSFQVELDARYDKYERLLKKSRDLTIESKRIIFLLHRVSSGGKNEHILHDAEKRLIHLNNDVLLSIAKELTKQEIHLYLRAISPGLQEYVEAISFYHYLKHGELIHIEEIHNPKFLTQSGAEHIPETQESSENGLSFSDILNPVDYVLGIADLTGELMRKCINSVASGGIDEPFELCTVLQSIYEAFLVKYYCPKDLRQKIFTLKRSLEKVENACYAIKIRGSEVPQHMLADFFYSENASHDVGLDGDV